MSHFYGTLQGCRGQATRCGSKSSGIEASAGSWYGGVDVRVFERNDVAWARVSFTTWTNGAGRNLMIYDGPVNPTNDELISGLHVLEALGLGPLGKQALAASAKMADYYSSKH